MEFSLDGSDVRPVWQDRYGGTTAICQIRDEEDTFLAIEGAYKGFHCEQAGIIHVSRTKNGWNIRRIAELPFAHRMMVIRVGVSAFVLVATLCGGKDNRDDWSKPGALYIGQLDEAHPETLALSPLLEGIHQNHGMCRREWGGESSLLISGREGLFEIAIPKSADGEWPCKKLLDEPISDIFPYDIDGDQKQEMIAITGFHGNTMIIYKERACGWERVYEFPTPFGHFVWGGELFGRRSILTGYRAANGGLVLLQKKPDVYSFDITFIDELEAPINLEVLNQKDRVTLFTTSGATHRVMRYTIEP